MGVSVTDLVYKLGLVEEWIEMLKESRSRRKALSLVNVQSPVGDDVAQGPKSDRHEIPLAIQLLRSIYTIDYNMLDIFLSS